MSFEPLLGPIQPSRYRLQGINWIILGAQTKPYRPPEMAWVEAIEKAAKQAGIAIFEKDNLRPRLRRPLIQQIPVVPGQGRQLSLF